MDVDHWMDQMDEQLADWVDEKRTEVKHAFPKYPWPVIECIMFSALNEEKYAEKIIEDVQLDERHIHAVCRTDYCEEYYQQEFNRLNGG